MTMQPIIKATLGQKEFQWDVATDCAQLAISQSDTAYWRGGLLPSFELAFDAGNAAPADVQYAQAEVSAITTNGDNGYSIALDYGEYGNGTLHVAVESWGIRFVSLDVSWRRECGIVALYFGARRMTEPERQRAPRLDRPFWPVWWAERLCVPCAGAGVTRSVMRVWELGHATLPLGSFGGAMGSLYAAAYPRPLYAAALGNKDGWLAFGPGSIPDAALSLQVQGATACLAYAYREDLWQPADRLHRRWDEPLRIAWGESAYDAYDKLYETFPAGPPKSPHHQMTFLCTWGDFRLGRFDLRHYADRVAETLPAQAIILDDSWETSMGTGVPNRKLFPHFDDDIAYMRGKGYDIALWQSIGWIDDPEAAGLTADDLICGADGKPRLWTWSGDPIAQHRYHYCLDPSSDRARQYLAQRTERIVRQYAPAALKLDFGYAMPGPDVAVPRHPQLRGERLCAELLRIVGDAARAAKPDITLIYYGIHPLLHDLFDMINLDDLGDAGDSAATERAGHNQRCIWASLAARRGMAINTSTGYYAGAVDSILLDTAVVGANGLTLGEFDSEGERLSPAQIGRWQALERWHRRTVQWRPLWLEANPGTTADEPSVRSWGRIEPLAGGERVTALTLRGAADAERSFAAIGGLRYRGDWAVIAQDDRDIADARQLACVPFAAGELRLDRECASVTVYRLANGRTAASATIAKPERGDLVLRVSEADLADLVGFVVEA